MMDFPLVTSPEGSIYEGEQSWGRIAIHPQDTGLHPLPGGLMIENSCPLPKAMMIDHH